MRPMRDLNMEVASQLQDLALVHASRHGRIAYRRSAQAVLRMEESVADFVASRSLRELRHLGPSSERVILEILEHGDSPTVARAIAGSGKRQEIETARRLRANFLSRAGALAVLRAPARGAIGPGDGRGDLQMHTDWSDGAESLAAMAAAGRARGYAWIGVSDHSYGLRIAGGMSMSDARKQQAEIDRLNAEAEDGFRIVKGIEANISAEGGVDLAPDELASFEIVLAAPHSGLRKSDDQTERMLAAVRTPHVRVLAHPRGRMMSRPGVTARWPEVFAEAARRGVAIELDGDPWRKDVDHVLAGAALAAGCLFAIDSDAHAGAELAYADLALAHARLAGIPPARVVNCWPVEQLLAWARDGRAPRARAPRRAAASKARPVHARQPSIPEADRRRPG